MSRFTAKRSYEYDSPHPKFTAAKLLKDCESLSITSGSSSDISVPNIGSITGRAVFGLGEFILQGVEPLVLRRKLWAIKSKIHGKNLGNSREAQRTFDELLELSRPGSKFYEDTIRRQALSLLLLQIARADSQTDNLILSVTKWPPIEVQLLLAQLIGYVPPFSRNFKPDKASRNLQNTYLSSVSNREIHPAMPFVGFLSKLSSTNKAIAQALFDIGFVNTVRSINEYSSVGLETVLEEGEQQEVDSSTTLFKMHCAVLGETLLSNFPHHSRTVAAFSFLHLPLRKSSTIYRGKSIEEADLASILLDTCNVLLGLSRISSYSTPMATSPDTAIVNCIVFGGDLWRVLIDIMKRLPHDTNVTLFKKSFSIFDQFKWVNDFFQQPIEISFLIFVKTVVQTNETSALALVDAGFSDVLYRIKYISFRCQEFLGAGMAHFAIYDEVQSIYARTFGQKWHVRLTHDDASLCVSQSGAHVIHLDIVATDCNDEETEPVSIGTDAPDF